MLIFFLSILILLPILKTGVDSKVFDVITNHKLNKNQTAKLIRSYTDSYGIQKLSACKVKLDNGDTIDLTSLDNVNAPRFFWLLGI